MPLLLRPDAGGSRAGEAYGLPSRGSGRVGAGFPSSVMMKSGGAGPAPQAGGGAFLYMMNCFASEDEGCMLCRASTRPHAAVRWRRPWPTPPLPLQQKRCWCPEAPGRGRLEAGFDPWREILSLKSRRGAKKSKPFLDYLKSSRVEHEPPPRERRTGNRHTCWRRNNATSVCGSSFALRL